MTLHVQADNCFFTSDTHFFHKAMVGLRNLSSVEEMNQILIDNWNKIVPYDGVVFHLGDVSFAGTAATVSVLGQLHGRIHLVKGNHDKNLASKVKAGLFASVQDYLEIDVVDIASNKRIILSHYAHRVWNMHHYGAWHLYGHSHGNLASIGKSRDVGVDTNNLFPLHYSEIAVEMEKKEIQVIDHHVPHAS